MCGTTMRGKVRWLSVRERDFVKELELKLVLDARIVKFDVKNNTSQVWSRSLVVICSDFVDDNPFLSIYQ